MKLKLKSNRFLKLIYPLLVIILCFVVGGCADQNSNFTVYSPEGELSVIVQDGNDRISYTLFKEGEELIGSSEIGILSKITKAKIIGSSLTSESKKWKPVWGQFSEIEDVYNELVLDIDLDGKKAKLFVRVYNQGIGLRYQIEGYKEGAEADFYCEYNLNGTDALYSSSGENSPIGPLSINEIKLGENKPSLSTPLVVEQSKKTYLSILESDLYTAPEFDVINFKFNPEKGVLTSSNKTKLKGDKTTTPWRVILVEDKIGDLVTNTVPLNLATPNQLEDASWVTPGKTLWDWRVHGYTADDGFTYGIDTESYMRFIDFAAEKGIEYFLIDDSWYTKVTKGHFELSDKLDLEQVIDYANEKDVQLLLYYDRRHGEYGDDELFKYYRSLGMKGIKYGFMGHNVPFTKDAIKASAENRLLIDFHDGPVPFTGIERTFPNAITKEYCHAQQDSRKAFTPETFIRMALINAIQGPLDMNNGNFDLTGINDGSREKGPKIMGSYLSTVASEAARTLIIHSGLVCIPDAPEAYSEKADLFEFIQKLPVGKWDESKVLHAKMGEYISTARRHGEEWFVGSVCDQSGKVLDIDLDFLKEGEEYKVTYYEDTPETHCKTNPEAYQIRTELVKKGTIIKATMAPGGGHSMWIRPE